MRVVLGGLALLAGGFFIGRKSKNVEPIRVEIIRTGEDYNLPHLAHLIRVYNPNVGRDDGFEILSRISAIEYTTTGIDAYRSRIAFEEKYPYVQFLIQDSELHGADPTR